MGNHGQDGSEDFDLSSEGLCLCECFLIARQMGPNPPSAMARSSKTRTRVQKGPGVAGCLKEIPPGDAPQILWCMVGIGMYVL